MVVFRSRIDRLRLEADAIFARIETVAVLVLSTLAAEGPSTSRAVAAAIDPYVGSIIKGSERKLSPKGETHKKHTKRDANRVLDFFHLGRGDGTVLVYDSFVDVDRADLIQLDVRVLAGFVHRSRKIEVKRVVRLPARNRRNDRRY